MSDQTSNRSRSSRSSGRREIVPVFPAGIDPKTCKDEMNLAEFPFAVLGDSSKRDDVIYQGPHGKGQLTITGSLQHGPLDPKDEDVLLGLIQLTRIHNKFRQTKTPFRPIELIRMMAWNEEGGRAYKRLRLSLDRWQDVKFNFDRSWYDPRLKDYLDARFQVIGDYVMDPKSRAQSLEESPSYFRWSENFLQYFQPDNFRTIDLGIYYALENDIAKRLYRFLGKRFRHHEVVKMKLKELTVDRLGLSPSYNTGQQKRRLQTAIRHLVDAGVIRDMPDDQRYQIIANTNWEIQFLEAKPTIIAASKRAPKLLAQPPAPEEGEEIEPLFANLSLGATGLLIASKPQPKPEPEPKPKPVVAPVPVPAAPSSNLNPGAQLLIDRGITRKTAESLAAQHSEEKIREKLETLDWMLANEPEKIKAPMGWLTMAISQDYPVPLAMALEREKARRKRDQDAKKERQEAERRQRAQEAAQKAAQRDLAIKYINSLGPDEFDALAQRGVAEADAYCQEAYLNAGPRNPHAQGLLKAMMADILEREGIPTA